MRALQLSNMGWCQAIVLVAFVGILQCDLSQTARCNCSNRRPTTIQFRIPNLNIPRNYPFYFPLPYPYANTNNKPYTNQQKCNTPKCNTKVQPGTIKISIPTALKNGWANIIIDTKNANVTTTNQNQGPIGSQKSNLNIVVHVSNSNTGKKNNATDPAVSAQTDVSATKDKDGKYITSTSSAKDLNSGVDVIVEVAQLNSLPAGGDGNDNGDIILLSDVSVDDGNGNKTQAISGVAITDEPFDDNNEEEVSPNPEPKPKLETPVTKDEPATDDLAADPTAANTPAKNTKTANSPAEGTKAAGTPAKDTKPADTPPDYATAGAPDAGDTTSDDKDNAAATSVSGAGTDGKGKSEAGSGSAAETSDNNGNAAAAGGSGAKTDANGNSKVASSSAAVATGDDSDAKSSADAGTASGKDDSKTATDTNAATTTGNNKPASDSVAGTTSGNGDSTASSDTDSAAKTGGGTS